MGNYYIIMIVHLSIYIVDVLLPSHSWALIHRHFPRFIKLGFHSSIAAEREITVPNAARTTWRNIIRNNAPFSGRHHSTKKKLLLRGLVYGKRLKYNYKVWYVDTHTQPIDAYYMESCLISTWRERGGDGGPERRRPDRGAVELLHSMNYSIERRKKKSNAISPPSPFPLHPVDHHFDDGVYMESGPKGGGVVHE